MIEKIRMALGIAPGLSNTAWAVVCTNHRNQFWIVDTDCIQTDPTSVLSMRISVIYQTITEVLQQHAAPYMCMEKVSFNQNPSSSCLSTAGVGYVCLLAAEMVGIKNYLFTPQQVKKAVGCGISVSKQTVCRFVSKLTNTEIIMSSVSKPRALARGYRHRKTL